MTELERTLTVKAIQDRLRKARAVVRSSSNYERIWRARGRIEAYSAALKMIRRV